ncbi:Hsp20/alpha crystallin family protein [Natrialbaceae archaeon A-arb3/5]
MSAIRDALQDLSEDVFFDLLESEGAYLLVLDVPGVTAESLDLSIEDGRLSLEAKREKELPGQYEYLAENRSLFFDVTLPVPDDALGRDATVSVDRGVLELELPKRDQGKTTINVIERNGHDETDSADAESR